MLILDFRYLENFPKHFVLTLVKPNEINTITYVDMECLNHSLHKHTAMLLFIFVVKETLRTEIDL